MLLLVTKAEVNLSRFFSPYLGRLVQPRHFPRLEATARALRPWAADNDAFGGWDTTRHERWVMMLQGLVGVPGCKFVTVPDVVGDHDTTLEMFYAHRHLVTHLAGQPVAFVAQDGATPSTVPFHDIDALFLGGTTQFKLGPDAALLADEARARGKWLHMGRVNSRKRLRYAHSLGCDSVDGTSFSMFTDTHLPWALELLHDLDAYPHPLEELA